MYEMIESGKKLTGSLQLPPGASPHLSHVSCMRPCSPPPPTVAGLQVLSCMANEASKIGGTKIFYFYDKNKQGVY